MEKVYLSNDMNDIKSIALFFGSLKKGGTENTIVNLANTLVEKGHKVSIILLNNEYVEYEIDNRVKVVGLNSISNKPLERMNNLRKIIKCERFDIVATFSIKVLTYLFLCNPLKHYRVVGFERSNPYLAVDGAFWRLIKKILPLWADGYVFQTSGAKRFYKKRVQKNSRVIPNGLLGGITNLKPISFDERKPYKICSVGRLQPGKGYDNAITAIARIIEEYPLCKYYIYGEGPEREHLEELIRYYCKQDSIFLLGQVNDVYNEIQDASVFVFSSKHEGMPNALLEAMACGIPCVATNCDFGPSELISSGINGVLVDVDDEKSIYYEVKNIFDNKEYAHRLSEEAYKIRETNSWEKISNDYIRFLLHE